MATENRRRQVGRRIAAARKAQGLSQPALAALVEKSLGGSESVKQSAVSFWESGRSIPTPAKLRALETILEDLEPGELHGMLWPREMSFVPSAASLSATVARLSRVVRRAREKAVALMDTRLVTSPVGSRCGSAV